MCGEVVTSPWSRIHLQCRRSRYTRVYGDKSNTLCRDECMLLISSDTDFTLARLASWTWKPLNWHSYRIHTCLYSVPSNFLLQVIKVPFVCMQCMALNTFPFSDSFKRPHLCDIYISTCFVYNKWWTSGNTCRHIFAWGCFKEGYLAFLWLMGCVYILQETFSKLWITITNHSLFTVSCAKGREMYSKATLWLVREHMTKSNI